MSSISNTNDGNVKGRHECILVSTHLHSALLRELWHVAVLPGAFAGTRFCAELYAVGKVACVHACR
jgi:hypothetical protein